MFKPRKVGCSDSGRRGLHEGGRELSKYLKRGWNRKEEGETKILKRGDKLGEGVGALKKRGSGGGAGVLEPSYEL